jgi:predicted phage tail protein
MTRERLSAFDQITTQRPLVFCFSLERTAKPILTEFLARCNSDVPKPTPPRKNGSGSRGRVFATRATGIDPAQSPGKMIEAVDGNDLFTEISTQDKQVSVEEINRQVTEFFNKSKASVEELETRITTELQEIVSKLADQKATLSQFAQQHKHLTESTTVENTRIAGLVNALEAEFEARHGETSKKREALASAVMQDIIVEKKRFLEETQAAFQHNAIIGLSDTISTLQETMCSTFT